MANLIKVIAIVDINHHEPERLHLFKVVGKLETRLEIRIQVIHDDLSAAHLKPIVVSPLLQDALRVRFAERVHIFKFASGYEQVNLHLHAASCRYHIYLSIYLK